MHPQAERVPLGRARVHFFQETGEIWTVGVYNLVVLACVLRTMPKKVVNIFRKKSGPPEKILATPMRTDDDKDLTKKSVTECIR